MDRRRQFGSLDKFQPNMPLLHDAGRGEQAGPAGYKDWLGVAVAQRFKLAQPACEHGCDAIERQLGVDAEPVLGLSRGQMFFGIEAQALLELGQSFGGHCKADSKGVAAETGEKIGA